MQSWRSCCGTLCNNRCRPAVAASTSPTQARASLYPVLRPPRRSSWNRRSRRVKSDWISFWLHVGVCVHYALRADRSGRLRKHVSGADNKAYARTRERVVEVYVCVCVSVSTSPALRSCCARQPFRHACVKHDMYPPPVLPPCCWRSRQGVQSHTIGASTKQQSTGVHRIKASKVCTPASRCTKAKFQPC